MTILLNVGRLLPNTTDKVHQNQEVWSSRGVCTTLKASHYKDPPKVLICASRGRNPEHPTDRRRGQYLEQRLEIQENPWTNTITSVEKDNYVLEIR